MRRVAMIGWIVIALALATAAQTPPRDVRPAASPPPTGSAAISGVVVTAESGAPVRLAYVVIIGASTGTLRVTSTDGNGHFGFVSLAADRYVIGASKAPFLGAVAGAKRPARSGAPIALADGQQIGDVTIRLPLGAAIAGTVTDERGQPGANVAVTVQQRRMQNGERTLVSVPSGNVTTDERGRYRIYGLPPGEYVVAAMRFGGQPSVRVLTDGAVDDALRTGRVAPGSVVDPTVRYGPVFFPGTARASDASPIVLAAGEERQSVDFRLELVRTARVEGTVTTSDGQPLTRGVVMIGTASPESVMQSSMATGFSADGHFVLPTLGPGSYIVIARSLDPSQPQFATAALEMAGLDQLGLQLTMRPPLSFSARLAFEGTAPAPALAGRRIPLRSLTPLSGMAAPQVAATNDTGTFAVTNIFPGRYVLGGPLFFGATSDSVTWALQSVVIDGRDVTDRPFDITSEAVPKDAVITYGDRWQALSGRLSRSSGELATDYTIVVFPAEKAYWIPGSRRILTTRPGTDGRFVLSGPGPATLPPGQYLLAAVTDIDRDEQFDPAFLASLAPAAVPVLLQPGEKKVQDLVIK